MELTRLAGIVIIVSFVIFWIGNLYSPPGAYQETDLDVRLQSVDENPGRWALSQGLGGVGIGIIVLGLLILSIDSAGDYRPWLTYLPAVLNILAVVMLSIMPRPRTARLGFPHRPTLVPRFTWRSLTMESACRRISSPALG